MTRDRKIEIVMAVIFGVIFLYANFVTVRLMVTLGTRAYTYERLSVAYDIGGEEGMEKELAKILAATNAPHSAKIGREFALKKETLKDPGAYVSAKVERIMRQLHLLKTARTVAITLLICGALIRIIRGRRKRKAA